MSSSKNNTNYKKTSFLAGTNAEFINEFYADYLSDPNSLPESWRQFFEGLSDEQKLIYNDLKGPSWSPERKNKKIILEPLEIKKVYESQEINSGLDLKVQIRILTREKIWLLNQLREFGNIIKVTKKNL
jgi:2-oxoglutarate dehydrogenase E1 component